MGSKAGRSGPRSRRRAPPVVRGGDITSAGDPDLLTAGKGGIAKISRGRGLLGGRNYRIEGVLRPSLRGKRLFSTDTYMFRGSEIGLTGYDRAHLWGPGFGDEALAGITYAPSSVNRGMQNRMEGFLRESVEEARRIGAALHVTVSVETHPSHLVPSPVSVDAPLLKTVEYRFEMRRPGEGTVTRMMTLEVPAPNSESKVATITAQGSMLSEGVSIRLDFSSDVNAPDAPRTGGGSRATGGKGGAKSAPASAAPSGSGAAAGATGGRSASTPRLQSNLAGSRLLSRAGRVAGLAAGFLIPDPTDALFMLYEFFKSYAEAREEIRQRNIEQGFAVGISASLLKMPVQWVRDLKPGSVSGDVVLQVLNATGIPETAFYTGAVEGYLFGHQLPGDLSKLLRRMAAASLAEERKRTGRDMSRLARVAFIARILTPPVREMFLGQRRQAELKRKRELEKVPVLELPLHLAAEQFGVGRLLPEIKTAGR